MEGEDNGNGGLSDVQEMVLSLLPVASALLSAWGSYNIIYMIATSDKKPTTYRRVLLGLSATDLFLAL